MLLVVLLPGGRKENVVGYMPRLYASTAHASVTLGPTQGATAMFHHPPLVPHNTPGEQLTALAAQARPAWIGMLTCIMAAKACNSQLWVVAQVQ
jgi:hypothetical protein